MQQAILTLNTGSSSIKFALFFIDKNSKTLERIFCGQITIIDSSPHLIAKNKQNETFVDAKFEITNHENPLLFSLKFLINWLKKYEKDYKIVAAGHRIVHGGKFYAESIITNTVAINNLKKLIPLAPLHQYYNLLGIELLSEHLSHIPQIACFDTAFHADLPILEQTYALPESISEQPIKRYGFHGLSYEYIAQVLPQSLSEKAAQGKIIIAHLGHGSSLCALENRRSIATTMGLTALEGLPMSTRCGDLDPGAVLYLLSQPNMSIEKLTQLFYEESGLLGVSGISGDVRILLENKSSAAQKAIDLFVYRINREIGALTAVLGGLNSIIFTAGIGENSHEIRSRICKQTQWLNIELNEKANLNNDLKISSDNSKVSVWVIPTNEELMIAQHSLNLLLSGVYSNDK